MKPMNNPRAAEILHQRVRFLEHHFPSHPANQVSQREEIYALQLGIAALNEQEQREINTKAADAREAQLDKLCDEYERTHNT